MSYRKPGNYLSNEELDIYAYVCVSVFALVGVIAFVWKREINKELSV